MQGFSMQVNALAPIGSFGMRTQITLLASLFIVLSIIFAVIGAVSTNILARYSSKRSVLDDEPLSFLSRLASSPYFVGTFCFATLCIVILWALVVCACAVFSSFYLVFIGAVYSFCSLVDNQCFDFTVLLPALVSKLTNKKVDLTFCKEKKEDLCSARNNQIWPFIGSFVCSIIALIGLGYFLMCMTANYTRLRSEKRARKGDHYAMNHGTVDSNSFIMTNMSK